MKPRHKKFAVIISAVIGISVAALFIADAFRSNMVFFYSPTDVFSGKAPVDREFRLGGMVKNGSVKKVPGTLKVEFVVWDQHKELPVTYEGILPDLFREGQGVITQGRLQADNQFIAREVLAKHDENYMPPEVADAMKRGKQASEGGKPAPAQKM